MRVFLRLLAGTVRGQRQYAFDFFASLVLYAALTIGDFAVVALILARFRLIAGWRLPEIALLFGISGTAMGLDRTFTQELHHFERYILTGDFDAVLLRPWPSLLVLLVRGIDLGRLGAVLQGLGVTVWGAAALGLPAAAWGWLLLFGTTGFALVLAIEIATAACAFWLERVSELQVFTLYAPSFAAEFPLQVYPGWLRVLFFTVIPIAFVNYVPVRALLGHGGGLAAQLAPLPAAAVALWLATRLWSAGERRYRSTGS